nr:pi035 [Schizosaccharomyces pombe]
MGSIIQFFYVDLMVPPECVELANVGCPIDPITVDVGKDVCFSNQKFFYQFLFYGFSAACMVLISTAIMISRTYHYRSLPGTWIFVLVFSAFGVLFLGVMLVRHTGYLLLNINSHEAKNWKTRIYSFSVFFPEHMDSRVLVQSDPGDLPWDRGYSENWRAVMGDHWYNWILPLRRSPGDGEHFLYSPSFVSKMQSKALSMNS